MNAAKELEKRYPTYRTDKIREINAIFSISPHSNEKYVVKPKINILHVVTGYALYSFATSPFPFSLIHLPIFGLAAYGFYALRTSEAHELSHSYRRRYLKFMKDVRGSKKASRFVSFIDKLENESLDSLNKLKSFLYREAALILSLPIVLGKHLTKNPECYWEEELAKYEAEKLTGIKVNSVSDEEKKFFEFLEALRTDEFIPLKNPEGIDEKTRFYLEHPPAIIPKYEMIDKLYRTFKKS